MEAGQIRLTPATVDAIAPIIRQRLKQAGVRLAHLLDQTLGAEELR